MLNKVTYNEEWGITKIFAPQIVFTEEVFSSKKTSRKLCRFPLVSHQCTLKHLRLKPPLCHLICRVVPIRYITAAETGQIDLKKKKRLQVNLYTRTSITFNKKMHFSQCKTIRKRRAKQNTSPRLRHLFGYLQSPWNLADSFNHPA